jgi:hypothetical protein
MRRARKSPLRTTKMLDTSAKKIDLASKAASTIAADIMRKIKLNSAKSDNGKITIHIHIGDLVMMGFDEAIDAEEWGMRENNTEINESNGSTNKRAKASPRSNETEDREKARRTINFRKGALELTATEDSRPRRRIKLKKVTKRNTIRKPIRKVARKK